MKIRPQIGDIWYYTGDIAAEEVNLLVVKYNERSETYTCLELETGSYTNWTMSVKLFPELWKFIA